eukprot:2579_1
MHFQSCFLFLAMLMLFKSQSVDIMQQPCYYHNKDLPVPLTSHQMAYFKNINTVYIFGGMTSNSTSVNTIYKWNLTNKDLWFEQIKTTTPTKPFSSWINNVITIDNRAYFIGIVDDNVHDNSMYIFDSLTDQFVNTTNLSKWVNGTILGCIATNKTHIFVVGGVNDNPPHLRIYNINLDQWISNDIDINIIKEFNGYVGQYCQILDDTLFVFGGFAGINNRIDINDYYKYDLKTEIWSDGQTKLQNAAGYGATIYYDSHIFLIGGLNATDDIADIYVFNTNDEQFGNTYQLVHAVRSFPALIFNNQLYTFGGSYFNQTNATIPISLVQICNLNVQSPKHTDIVLITVIAIIAFGCLIGIIICVRRRCVVVNPVVIRESDVDDMDSLSFSRLLQK